MLKWIGKVLGSSAGATSPAPTAVWLQRLHTYLAPLDRLSGGGLAGEVLAYVRDGDGPQVLSELARLDGVADALHLMQGHACRVGSLGPALYDDMTGVSPTQLLRWARALQAAAAQLRHPRFGIPMADGSHWAEILLMHSVDRRRDPRADVSRICQCIDATLMEATLVEAQLPPTALLTACFGGTHLGFACDYGIYLIKNLPGYSEWVVRHADVLRPLVLAGDMYTKSQVMALMTTLDLAALGALAVPLCEMACGGNREVREQAEPLVRACQGGALAPLSNLARQGKPEQRSHALRLLWAFADQAQDAALRTQVLDLARQDRAASVRSLIDEWQAPEVATPLAVDYDVPVIDWAVRLTAAQLDALEQLCVALNDDDRTAVSLDALTAYLGSADVSVPTAASPVSDYRLAPVIEALAQSQAMTPVLLFKVLVFFDALQAPSGGLGGAAQAGFDALHLTCGQPTLMGLAQLLVASGRDGDVLWRDHCRFSFADVWGDDAVVPYLALHVQGLEHALAHLDDYFSSTVYRAIARVAPLAAPLLERVFAIALGANQVERVQAQRALAQVPGKESWLLAGLASGKADVRLQSAQWLGRVGHEPAVAALEQTLAKEKNDAVRTALLDVLEGLGQPVEQYLDRHQWLAECTRAAAKGVPKDLTWFPWDTLPGLRWADTDEPLPLAAVQGMLAQAVKLKSAEPGASLRRFCSLFAPHEREAFGQFVLQAWLQEDTRPIPAQQAQALADSRAHSTLQYIQRYPQHYQGSPLLGKSHAELVARFLPALLRQPAGSAVASKGLLAVVAACAGAQAAPLALRYLKTFYGTRAHQGKALIAMLGWIDHDSAAQALLSLASRFRTRSFQQEAITHARALAKRKGWAVAQLADRTLPSAGFDEQGVLELSYGERSFTARLLPDFSVELFNGDGKKIAALPEPRQDDDAEEAKASKQHYSGVKKALATIVQQQTARLYDALCTGRDWAFADWQRYLNQHPVMRHLLQRLIWVQVENDQVVAIFRPLDDGSLTDSDDNPLQLGDEARVRLAHESLLSADEVAQWQSHLVDYAVTPLFQQLGKGVYRLPEAPDDPYTLKDFQGHLLDTFALRNRAQKLGYTRGGTEDGGWFYTYEKSFVSLGLAAVIRFTGNPLPETNRTVALLDLTFYRRDQSLDLADVPPILLSECYHDLRLIAAQGTGFDPQWKTRSEY
ncbi:DUF4132 domain-containing protein [Pseudomonas sp. TE3610]